MTDKEWIFIVIIIYILHDECYGYMYASSFVSDWYEATAQNGSLSLLTIDHNLGEYPVKVDVQVKINEGGKDYIFTGLGSSQRDDDLFIDYGGVIYIYNDKHIKLTFPYARNHAPNGGLAYTEVFRAQMSQQLFQTAMRRLPYTEQDMPPSGAPDVIISFYIPGSNGLYYGPTNLLGPYNAGYVRARVWLASDMPQIVLNTSVFMNNVINYKEINHGLGYSPDMVNVQSILSDGYISEGVGAVFLANTSIWYNELSGVLYGYDDSKIRLWVPSKFGNFTGNYGGIFAAKDGYKLGKKINGTVNVLGWTISCSQQVFYRTFTVGQSVVHDHTVSFPCNYDVTVYFVTVQYKVPAGDTPNGGMIFNGVGTTQATDLFNYGGIVYVYTESEVLIWRPNNTAVVYIGERWGQEQYSQLSNTADVIIRVFYLHESECPHPEAIANGIFHTTGQLYGDNVTYTCNSGYDHSSGNLIRTCERHRTWSGIIPSCTACELFQTNSSLMIEDIEVILQRIRVDKKTTSSHKRSLTSAPDHRQSAFIVGVCGVSILTSVTCFFILPDLIVLARHICWFRTIFGE